jgi:hypothetical protein
VYAFDTKYCTVLDIGCPDIRPLFLCSYRTIMRPWMRKENELQIHQIQSDQGIRFLALNGDKILLKGDSIKEVLTAFDELPVVICNGG